MKLLIVDDSNVIRRSIERMVGQHGFEIKTASNGLEALRVFKDFEPHAVTMDITMPHMDGLACIKEMLALTKDVRILVISALADKATAVEAVDLGAEGFLLKPFTERRLNEEIGHLLSET